MGRKRLPKTKVASTVGRSKSKTKPKTKSRTTPKGFSTPDSLEPLSDVDRAEPETTANRTGYVPDPVEWADPQKYITYNSFRRQGAGGSMRVGEFVYIWGSEGNELDQDPFDRTRWLGKIIAIRASAKDKVFMEVAWCYTSAEQLKESGISFSQKQLAENECVMSDLRDVISVWCAEEQAVVKRFDELDPWQEDIDDGDEYYRSEVVQDRAGKLKVVAIRPNPKGRKLYKPLPLGSTPMVYCPRHGCLKWYHQSQTKKLPTVTKEQLLEMQSTGLQLQNPSSSSDAIPNNHNLLSTSTSTVNNEGSEAWRTIVRCASSSITRGIESIVGNTIPVLEAREIVSLVNQDITLDETVKIEAMAKDWLGKYEPDGEEEAGRWICPGCKGVI